MKLFSFGSLGVSVCFLLTACSPTEKQYDEESRLGDKPVRVAMVIADKGEIVMEFYPNKAPSTCRQIISLVKSGFYNGQKIHRVEDWVIQWGDPQSKTLSENDPRLGSGGSGNPLPFEETDVPMARGVVAMASVGERVGGDSQIFILKKDTPFLQGKYCGFGKVVRGMDIVDKLEYFDHIQEMRVLTD